VINGACQSIVVLSQIVGDQFSMMRLRVNPQIALNSHYSPDLNPIEHDFTNLKKRRQFAPPNTLLADIIKSYGNNCP